MNPGMEWIDAGTARDYLLQSGHLRPEERVSVRELAGGVSNLVLRVTFLERRRPDFILKQARPQLRTPDPWFCSVERIWREVDVLETCQRLLRRDEPGATADGVLTATTPDLLFADRQRYLFAMSAAPAAHDTWKGRLLAGHPDVTVARACGVLLGHLHARSWRDAALAARLGDRQIFRELRIDPYYRAVARRFPEAAPLLHELIEEIEATSLALTHADFSPKNLLIYDGGLMLVDFETGHFGDPAFDLGFFLSHLVLKAFYHAGGHEPYLALIAAFTSAYDEVLRRAISAEELRQLTGRGIRNLAGCAWARLDGTSQVEYLKFPHRRDAVRSLCRELLPQTALTWHDLLECVLAALTDWERRN